MKLGKKEKLEVAIEVLKKYKIEGSEPIVEALSEKLAVIIERNLNRIRQGGHHISIIDKNGDIISTSNNRDTFLMVIKTAGFQDVKNLGIEINSRPFITDSPDPKLKKKYRSIGNGMYIYKVITAKSMKPIIETICDKLGLSWTVYL